MYMMVNRIMFKIISFIHSQIIDPVILFFITLVLYVLAYILSIIEKENRKRRKNK